MNAKQFVAEARLRTNGALSPVELYRKIGVRSGLIKERGAATVATGL